MKKIGERTEHLEPIIIEKKIWNMQYAIFAIAIGIIILISIATILFYFDLSLLSAIAMVSIFIAFYSMFLFFLIEPQILREVQKREVRTQTYEKPVIKEVVKEVIKEIEKPEVREVIKRIESPEKRRSKTIYITKARKKIKFSKYDFFGSTETKTYHKNTCRLGKLIKSKYKETGNTKRHFLTRGYKACKVCLNPKKAKKTKRVKRVKKPKVKIKRRIGSIAKRAAEIRKRRKASQDKIKIEKIEKILKK